MPGSRTPGNRIGGSDVDQAVPSSRSPGPQPLIIQDLADTVPSQRKLLDLRRAGLVAAFTLVSQDKRSELIQFLVDLGAPYDGWVSPTG